MPNRYLCDVLENMRKCYETRNFAQLLGLIEEAQWMASRMEAAISDKGDIERYRAKRSEIRDEIKKLHKAQNKMREKAGKPTKELSLW